MPSPERPLGYLRRVLRDGARPFLYRSRLRRLLGLPESGLEVAYTAATLPPVGFRYLEARLPAIGSAARQLRDRSPAPGGRPRPQGRPPSPAEAKPHLEEPVRRSRMEVPGVSGEKPRFPALADAGSVEGEAGQEAERSPEGEPPDRGLSSGCPVAAAPVPDVPASKTMAPPGRWDLPSTPVAMGRPSGPRPGPAPGGPSPDDGGNRRNAAPAPESGGVGAAPSGPVLPSVPVPAASAPPESSLSPPRHRRAGAVEIVAGEAGLEIGRRELGVEMGRGGPAPASLVPGRSSRVEPSPAAVAAGEPPESVPAPASAELLPARAALRRPESVPPEALTKIRQAVYELASKAAPPKKSAPEEPPSSERPRSAPGASRPAPAVVLRPPAPPREPAAFWERSYLNHSLLRTLR